MSCGDAAGSGAPKAGIFLWKHSRILADRASREAQMCERSELTAFSNGWIRRRP